MLLAGLLVACHDDPVEPNGVEPVSEYAVPLETALARLDAALEALYDGEAETRVGAAKPRIASVLPVKMADMAAATRSGELPDVENLLYVVAFEGQAGCAVLGADARAGEVYAILDETVLTVDDFTTRFRDPEDADGDSQIVDFVVGQIVSDAILRIVESEDAPAGEGVNAGGISVGGGGGFIPAPVYRRVLVDVYRQAPLTHTKWHQNDPFNGEYPFYYNANLGCYVRNSAGCGNIAVGQILAYHQSGSTITISGNAYSWALLNELNYGSYPSVDAKSEMARFIYALALNMRTKYYDDGSSGVVIEVVPGVLNALGLHNARIVAPCDYVLGREMICAGKKPFYIRAEDPDYPNSGHAWVVDGWNEYTEQCWETTFQESGKMNPETLLSETHYCMVHCNYGWGGSCDGYYYKDLFDTTARLEASKIDGSVGDYAAVLGYKFVRNIKMVVYDK